MKLSDNVYDILKNWVIPILTGGTAEFITDNENGYPTTGGGR